SFYARVGQVIALPHVESYVDSSGCCGAIWEANGAGAQIQFPILTNLAGNPTWSLDLRAFSGGKLRLSAVVQMPDSNLALLADGSNSVVELPLLSRYSGAGHTLGLTAQNRGGIQISNLTRLNRGSVTKTSGGLIDLIQLTN